MRVLIGTPIHECKDYCMEQWLQNVAELQKISPADLLLVDNSKGPDYVEKVREYCKKHRVKNYAIDHLELPAEQDRFERVARSREIIRKEIISKNYDAWFCWESDQIIPADALDNTIRLQESGNFMIVSHDNLIRQNSEKSNFDFGIALIKRECLEKYSFLLEFGSDPEMPKTWEPGEEWFRKRVLRGGGNYIEVKGVVEPIYHIDG